MKSLLFFLFIRFGFNGNSQSYKNLDNYKGFKEIWIGEKVSNYAPNVMKINKNDRQSYSGMPITDYDVYMYQSPTTKTIFGLEIAVIYLVTNLYDEITNITILTKRPDNTKQVLNFYESEFGKPYESIQDVTRNPTYTWQGKDIAVRVMYISNSKFNSIHAVITYFESYYKAQQDK